ncbi:hypothetical protein C5167_014602 [Papaver somniferum]|uniref:Uncharacterized protein n=1 Tax=Papaver somniferum TaxID=3469 RepID=A0A4Y7J743_PAPSO|nr:hypothetical protein C5167_014602 [Papaver somniferum]
MLTFEFFVIISFIFRFSFWIIVEIEIKKPTIMNRKKSPAITVTIVSDHMSAHDMSARLSVREGELNNARDVK